MTPGCPTRRAAGAPSNWRRPGAVATLALALLLSACAGPPVTQAAFDAHQARFSQAQAHLRHTVSRLDGGRLAVREFNPALRGRVPTLVLMHGFPDNQHLYDALIPLLARKHHVLSFDFLGWGASDKPAAALDDVASQRTDLDTVVAHFALQQVVPVLHDMSGPVGIDWALAHGAPAIRPAFFSATSVLWQEINTRAGRTARLRQSPVPVLVAFGQHDPYLNPQVAQALADQFAQARVSLLDAGHDVQLDRPAELAGLIDQLLAGP